MIKDILGEILDAKKNGAMTVTIDIKPMKETEEESLETQGLMPDGEDSEKVVAEEPMEMKDDSKDLMMDEDDQRQISRRKMMGEKPRGLGDRVKMDMMK